MRSRFLLQLLPLAVALAAHSQGCHAPVVVGPKTPLVVLSTAPSGILSATDDLAEDMARVFGSRPPIVHQLPASAPSAIVIGEFPGTPTPLSAEAPAESFSIVAECSAGTKAVPRLRLDGADMRGTIFAIYQFSQQFLGTDPMYFWTDKQPARRTTLTLDPALHQLYPAPAFRYRGFFINDEDLLTGWAPGLPGEGTGIRLDVWNKIYETVLRLKGNLIVPGTWVFPNEPSLQLASRRGLILNQHHAEPLGINAARWPRGVPYNYTTHPEILEAAWKRAVDAVPEGTEYLWTVGLRGLSDQSYAALDPAAKDDKVLGALISKAIAKQVEIVRARFPNAHFATDLWQEGAHLQTQGLLTIPPDVITVWADTGYGYLQDRGTIKPGAGAYFHVAMMNNEANQLTEMVPPERIVSEQARLQRAGATSVFLVNTSDLRPVAMSARATMQFAWSGTQPGAQSDNSAAAGQYLHQWAEEEFGAAAAPAVEDVYAKYYAAPAYQSEQAHRGEQPRVYGDQLYHTEARQLMLSAMLNFPLAYLQDQAPKWTPPHITGSGGFVGAIALAAREESACSEAEPRWEVAWQAALAAESQVTPERRPFYRAEVLTMISIQRESNAALLHIARALLDQQRKNLLAAIAHAQQAQDALDRILAQEKSVETGTWQHWYRGDWLVGIPRTRQLTASYLAFLHDPEAPVPPPILWNDWEAYYHILQYEGDRTVDISANPK